MAQERTKPTGRVLGIDLIPAQPPRGVSTIQGNFLSPDVQELARQFLAEAAARKPALPPPSALGAAEDGGEAREAAGAGADDASLDVVPDRPSYIELERASAAEAEARSGDREANAGAQGDRSQGNPRKGDRNMVDVRLIAVRKTKTVAGRS